MKRKSLKIFVLGLSVAMGISMLVGCSSEGGSSSTSVSSNKLNIAVKDKYVVNSKDNKYGLMSFDKKQVIPFKYDYLGYLSSADLFIAQKDGKYGVIDIDEKEILPFKYSSIGMNDTKDKLYASDYKTTTVFNLDGKKVKSLNYGSVWDSGKGSAIVGKDIKEADYRLNGKFGLIDESEKEILKPEYSCLLFIREYDKETNGTKYLSVYAEKDGKAGIFSLEGEVIIPMEYNSTNKLDTGNEQFYVTYNGYTQSYFVNKGEKYGVLDKSGKQIIETKYDSIRGDHNGYIATLDEKDTVYDLKGNVMLSDDTIDVVRISDNGLISVVKDDESYYVDSKGNKVEIKGLKNKEHILTLGAFDELGNAYLRYGVSDSIEVAMINEEGDTVIGPFKEDENMMINIFKIGNINENSYFTDVVLINEPNLKNNSDYVVEVREPDKNDVYQTVNSTLYDKTGKKKNEFKGTISYYEASEDLYDIYIKKNEGYLHGLMNRDGKAVVEPIYDYISTFYDDYLVAQKGDKHCLLDKGTGKVVIEY
ncbi:WG repeat-containing protein [Amedibacillus sp. YH-ame10]